VVEYQYDAERNLLTTTVTGMVQDDDFHNGFPDIPAGTLELVDMTRADGSEVSTPAVRRMVDIDRNSPPRVSRMAIVANTEAGFGLARMYQALMEGSGTQIHVFRDLAKARSWLGLPE
jgi:hypothetical protein